MNILLTSYFALFPQLVFQPAGNELAWLDMPTNTVQERKTKEAARKNWAKKKRILDAMAKGDARKKRIADAKSHQLQLLQQRQQQYRYRNNSSYQNNSSYSNNYGPRYRYVNIPTPTGTVRYLVPY